MKTRNINQVGILVEVLLVISLIYMLIMTLFLEEFKIALTITAGLTLISMAYNSAAIHKKMVMTIIYASVGILSLLSALLW